jgi:hypothetical protein
LQTDRERGSQAGPSADHQPDEVSGVVVEPQTIHLTLSLYQICFKVLSA